MSGQRGMGPVIDDALGRGRHELPGAIVDQAHDLRARFVVETACGKNLRDLLAELSVAFKRGLDVLADRLAQSCL